MTKQYPPPTYGPHRHPPLAHAAVHFPPSPTLTRTFTVHSPTTYDRSPIVVGPNSCALPERGGRTYTLDDTASDDALERSANSRRLLNDHRHPRAFGRGSYTHADSTAMPMAGQQYTPPPIQAMPPYPPFMLPPLIADCSSSSSSCSESEESDGVHSPPLDFRTVNSIHGLAIPIPNKAGKPSQMYNTQASPSTPMPLSFLPHPPSAEDEQLARSSRRRRRPSPSPPTSNMNATMEEHGFGTSPKSMRSRGAMKTLKSSSSFALCSSMSGLGLDDSDSGCLGGF